MKVPRSFRPLAFVLPALTAALLLGHGSAMPTTDSSKTMQPEGRTTAWASDASKAIPGARVWLAVAPQTDGTMHPDGAARSWAN
ncbi:hypothetical protein [Deinococcus sp. UYEF24]